MSSGMGPPSDSAKATVDAEVTQYLQQQLGDPDAVCGVCGLVRARAAAVVGLAKAETFYQLKHMEDMREEMHEFGPPEHLGELRDARSQSAAARKWTGSAAPRARPPAELCCTAPP